MGHPRSDRLQDYLDDLLCREERAELEVHLAACAQCTAEVVAERELRRALAALPRGIPPERDLLAGINAAIDADHRREADGDAGTREARDADALAAREQRRPQLELVTGHLIRPASHPPAPLSWQQRPIASLRYPLAAAALVLIAVTALVTTVSLRRDGQAPTAAATRTIAPPPTAVQNAVVRQVLASERSFVAAADELEAALAAGRGLLDPRTVALVEENLRVIDDALAEARAALRLDPNNAALAQLLRAAHEQKLELLRRATRASAGT